MNVWREMSELIRCVIGWSLVQAWNICRHSLYAGVWSDWVTSCNYCYILTSKDNLTVTLNQRLARSWRHQFMWKNGLFNIGGCVQKTGSSYYWQVNVSYVLRQWEIILNHEKNVKSAPSVLGFCCKMYHKYENYQFIASIVSFLYRQWPPILHEPLFTSIFKTNTQERNFCATSFCRLPTDNYLRNFLLL